MKKYNSLLIVNLLLVMSIGLSSCEALVDIFQAGMWVGIILVVLVVGIILWIIRKVKK